VSDFDNYQLAVKEAFSKCNTKRVPDHVYLALGVAGEAGEVADLVKKILLDPDGSVDKYRERLKEELGDTLFYLANICSAVDLDFKDVATQSIGKAKARTNDILTGERFK